jgi:hypothetical protein
LGRGVLGDEGEQQQRQPHPTGVVEVAKITLRKLAVAHSVLCFVQLLCKVSVKSVSNSGKSTELGFGQTADVVGGERGCGLGGVGAVVCLERV